MCALLSATILRLAHPLRGLRFGLRSAPPRRPPQSSSRLPWRSMGGAVSASVTTAADGDGGAAELESLGWTRLRDELEKRGLPAAGATRALAEVAGV